MIVNFKEETLNFMKQCNKTIDDIKVITTLNYKLDTETFFNTIDYEYDDGYGGAKINVNLRIAFKDGTYMYRHEYDGAEQWKYIEIPSKLTEVADVELMKIILNNDMCDEDYGINPYYEED